MHTPIRYEIAVTNRPNSPEIIGQYPSTCLETNDGDLVVSTSGDLALASEPERAAQLIRAVIATPKGSAKIFNSRIYQFGSRTRDFIGKLNTPTQRRALEKILLADLVDNDIKPVNSAVEVLRLTENVVVITFSVMVEGRPLTAAYRLDVMSGSIEDIGGHQI